MRYDARHAAMAVSLAVAVLMLAGKLAAYFITGSIAILSDAFESIVHIVATGFAAFSLWYAQQPASREHPYGYGKIAYFSAGFEGGLILIAAVFILGTAIWDLIRGPELQHLSWGLAITGGLCLVNLALGLTLVMVGRRRNALILVANGKHVLTDMWTSAGVVIGVGIVWLTDILWLDPLTAILVGVNILYTALGLIGKSFRSLLDAADPEHTSRLLDCLKEATESGAVHGFHQLRHRQSNDQMWVEVHMLLAGDMTTQEAHERVTQVEERMRQCCPGYEVHITTHIEPASHDTAHPEGHNGMNDPFATESGAGHNQD